MSIMQSLIMYCCTVIFFPPLIFTLFITLEGPPLTEALQLRKLLKFRNMKWMYQRRVPGDQECDTRCEGWGQNRLEEDPSL